MKNSFYIIHKINPLVVKIMCAEVNVMYLQFPNCKNIMDSCNLESQVLIYAHLSDSGPNVNRLEN